MKPALTLSPTRRAQEFPPEVYIALVDSLYQEGRTLLVGTIFIVGSVFTTYWKTGEPLLLLCALAFALVAGVRGLTIRAYNRVRSTIHSREIARQWEYRYVTGAAMSVALLGIWCFVAFARTDDPFAHLVSFSMTIAYMIGVFGRNFGSARFVIVQILCAWAPMTAALLLYGNIYYWIFAGLLIPFFMAVKFIAERLRQTLLDAVVTSRDMSALATRFDTALNNMPHGLCMFDADGRVAVANQKMSQLLGLPAGLKLRGLTASQLLRACAKAGTIEIADAKLVARNLEERLAKRSSQALTLETRDHRCLEITFQSMERRSIVLIIQDVTERVRAQAEINRLAHYDALTGLPNRFVLRDRIYEVLRTSVHDSACALLFIDLDQFKQVNDTLGHSRGDMLLKIVADRLRATIRDHDLAVRFGGDEFVLLQTAVKSIEDVSVLARRVVKALSQPYMIDGHEVVAGASVGIALSPRDGTNIDTLLKNADMALYRAKAAGRGTWRFFKPEMGADAQARRSLELDLRYALENDRLEVYFQPIVDLRTRRISTCEALVRWPHPLRGLVSAAEFIPIAEEMGLIVEIGKRVLRQACIECQTWPSDICVAVNLSPIQLSRGNVPAMVRDVLASTGLPAHRLELEITETALLRDTRTMRGTLQQLQDLGVAISLDDFGTGYSSLSYLHSFPLNKVKIDRSFLQGLGSSERTLTLLRGVARLSAELGLRVAVEGIETQQQLDLIVREGFVDEAQGYLLGRPVSTTDIRQLIYSPPRPIERVA